jgi:hypothetical protein
MDRCASRAECYVSADLKRSPAAIHNRSAMEEKLKLHAATIPNVCEHFAETSNAFLEQNSSEF